MELIALSIVLGMLLMFVAVGLLFLVIPKEKKNIGCARFVEIDECEDYPVCDHCPYKVDKI